MAEQLAINDPVNLLAAGVGGINVAVGTGTVAGTVDVDYTNDTVTGGPITLTPVNVTGVGAIGAQTYTGPFTLTQTGTDTTTGQPTYQITGSNGVTGFAINYEGQAPTTTTANVTLLSTGVSVAANPTGVSGTVTSTPVCFAAGTRLRTADGECLIEDLRVGDLLLTAGGTFKPVKWLGHRIIDSRRHPQPEQVHPVCIAAGAFGPDRPSRDLYVSPGHAICVNVLEDVLIPAASLINGATIRQVERKTITYWHVELDSHDVVVAENLFAESYIDVGNRPFFLENDTVSLAVGPDAHTLLMEGCCRPRIHDGPIVQAVRAQLRTRAIALGWRLEHTACADLHLLVEGQRIDPVIRDGKARFCLSGGAKDLWLVSETARPVDVREANTDSRSLGIHVGGISVHDGLSGFPIPVDDPRLVVGFHAVEGGMQRWTTGQALLPAALFEPCLHSCFLSLDIASPTLPRWVAPAEAAGAAATDAMANVARMVA
jgi:hypothetical protein